MRRFGPLIALVLLAGCGSSENRSVAPADNPLTPEPVATQEAVTPSSAPVRAGSVLEGTYTRLNGDRTDLAGYAGKVVLVVNTASHCGNTPQYAGLEKLYREHRGDGFVILGFPANDFGAQEPGSDAEIASFCKKNFGVSFPMFAKSAVTGDGANPLFRTLAKKAGEPDWNFAKYLIDRRGRVVERFPAATVPEDPQFLSAVTGLL